MTLQTRLSDLITAVATDYKQIKTWLFGSLTGSLSDLTTTNKSSFVAAINEVKASSTGAPPDASETVKGVVELATDAEALAFSSDTVVLTPGNLGSVRGAANGIAGLDSGGKIPAAQLPSYVDDVLSFANRAAFPGEGESGKIYVSEDDNQQWRWTGSDYIDLVSSPGSTDAVPEGSTNLYFTNARADNRITALIGNPDTDLAAAYAAAKV